MKLLYLSGCAEDMVWGFFNTPGFDYDYNKFTDAAHVHSTPNYFIELMKKYHLERAERIAREAEVVIHERDEEERRRISSDEEEARADSKKKKRGRKQQSKPPRTNSEDSLESPSNNRSRSSKSPRTTRGGKDKNSENSKSNLSPHSSDGVSADTTNTEQESLKKSKDGQVPEEVDFNSPIFSHSVIAYVITMVVVM